MMGLVSLVGAGPGDPDLLTIRAARRLAEADLVLHDGLVSPEVLMLAVGAERICVSRRPGVKAPGARTFNQSVVNQMMIEAARAGQQVVRLKAGDPFVLGRGGEEALALADAAVAFEIVPGLSAAVAAPEIAGIPVTHRGIASGFVVVSGHNAEAYRPILEPLLPGSLTIVVLMGFAERGAVAALLQEKGWPADTPAAIITNATQDDRQGIWTGPLHGVAGALTSASAEDAHTLVVGEVVGVGAVIARSLRPSGGRRRYAGSDNVRPRPPVIRP